MLLFIAKGILNGSGEFSSKSPRYWGKEDAGTRISLFSDPCVDDGGNCPSLCSAKLDDDDDVCYI